MTKTGHLMGMRPPGTMGVRIHLHAQEPALPQRATCYVSEVPPTGSDRGSGGLGAQQVHCLRVGLPQGHLYIRPVTEHALVRAEAEDHRDSPAASFGTSARAHALRSAGRHCQMRLGRFLDTAILDEGRRFCIGTLCDAFQSPQAGRFVARGSAWPKLFQEVALRAERLVERMRATEQQSDRDQADAEKYTGRLGWTSSPHIRAHAQARSTPAAPKRRRATGKHSASAPL